VSSALVKVHTPSVPMTPRQVPMSARAPPSKAGSRMSREMSRKYDHQRNGL